MFFPYVHVSVIMIRVVLCIGTHATPPHPMFFEIWVLWGDAGSFAAICVSVAQLVGLRSNLGRTLVLGHRFANDFRPCLGVGKCRGMVSHLSFTT